MGWKIYRHRFLPWILFNWSQRCVGVRKGLLTKQNISQADISNLKQSYLYFLTRLNRSLISTQCKTEYSQHHLRNSFSRNTRNEHELAANCMSEVLGFQLGLRQSSIDGAGSGVFVTNGSIPSNSLVAVYPGLIYMPGEPVFFQSIRNQFIFRCHDGVLIDGNDRGLSTILFRSCAGRDILGSHLTCDITWLTKDPVNPLAVGQYINNSDYSHMANVEYQEINLPHDIHYELLKYIPNTHYSVSPEQHNTRRRLVVLRSIKDISCGEELFSTYFTIVNNKINNKMH